MPAKERAVVERRAAWDGVVEIREGSFKRIRYAPHDDVFAPTVFLIGSSLAIPYSTRHVSPCQISEKNREGGTHRARAACH